MGDSLVPWESLGLMEMRSNATLLRWGGLADLITQATARGVIVDQPPGNTYPMSVPSYRFKAQTDLPDFGLVEGECLLITPGDPAYPLVATHPIDITPAQFFDAIMAGTLQPDHSPHEGSANPIYAIRNAMKWPWEEPVAAEDVPRDGVLTQDETVDVLYYAGMRVLPEPNGAVRAKRAELAANLVAPELVRMGYHLVGTRPIPRRQKGGLKLDVG